MQNDYNNYYNKIGRDSEIPVTVYLKKKLLLSTEDMKIPPYITAYLIRMSNERVILTVSKHREQKLY